MLYCFCSALFDLEIRGVLNRFAWSQEREKKNQSFNRHFQLLSFFSGKRGTTLGKRRKKMTSSTSTTLDSRSLELSLSYTHNATLDVLIAVTAEVINSFHFFFRPKRRLKHFSLCFVNTMAFSSLLLLVYVIFQERGKTSFQYSTLSRVGKEEKMLWKL